MPSELVLALLLAAVPRPAPTTAPSALPPSAVLLERVVAVVDERPVLLSEVRLLQAVKGLPEDEARRGLVDELLMQREAARLPGTRPEPEVLARAVAQLRSRAPGVPERELERLARRQLAILAYVEQRFRPLVRVEDSAVGAAVDLQWPEPAERPEDADVLLRVSLEDEQLDRLVEDWVKELREASDVRWID
jgi:hypothetical protein